MFDSNRERRLVVLQDQLDKARAITPDLIARVITQVCVRLPALHATSKTRIRCLIESGAYADATLALIEFELPQWSLRRLVHEDGEWHCSLSQHPELPISLDQTADASHQVLPLAILAAFVEARCRGSAPEKSRSPSVPQIQLTQQFALCCDNFR